MLPYYNLFPQWELRSNGLPVGSSTGYSLDAVDSNFAIVSIHYNIDDCPVLKTDNAGKYWEKLSWPQILEPYGVLFVQEAAVDISASDSNHIWLCTDMGRIMASADGGINWTIQYQDTLKTKFFNYIRMFDSLNGIAMGDGIKSDSPALFLFTNDGGINWTSTNDPPFDGGSGDFWRRLSFHNSVSGYFFPSGSFHGIYKTNDGGTTWFKTSFNLNVLLMKFYDDNLGLIISPSTGSFPWILSRTTNGFNTWDSYATSFIDWPDDFEFLPGLPSKVWYTDMGGLYFSSDTGRTWTEQKIYDSSLKGRDLVFTDKNHGWLLCDDGKVFYTSNNGGIITGIKNNKTELPKNYSLQQNYPNPFNPSTVISYNLPVSGKVVLKIYDILGNEVLTLVNMVQTAGGHQVVFNTQQTTSRSTELASGIYFYTLKAGDFTESKKMVLLK